jgi:hypothetical protein
VDGKVAPDCVNMHCLCILAKEYGGEVTSVQPYSDVLLCSESTWPCSYTSSTLDTGLKSAKRQCCSGRGFFNNGDRDKFI